MPPNATATARPEPITDKPSDTKPGKRKPWKPPLGAPPPLTFDLDHLPDSVLLTTKEVAAIRRCSVQTPARERKIAGHPLKWFRDQDGKPLYRLGDLRAYLNLPKRKGKS